MKSRKYPEVYWDEPQRRKTKKTEEPQTLLLSLKDASKYTGLSAKTLASKKKYMDHIQLNGKFGRVYFPIDSLTQYIRDNVIYGKNKEKN